MFPKKPPRFKYLGHAKDLYQDIQGLAYNPHLKVNKYYVHHQKTKLPPVRQNINDQTIFEMFDKVDWIANHDKLKKEIIADWSHDGLDFDREDPQACKNALRQGLTNYMDAIRNNKLPNTNPGTGMLANRYLDNIIFLLNHNQLSDEGMLSTLMRMGIEGGQSCPNGKIRVLEETFRELGSESGANLPAKFRVASLLQTDREIFFRQEINKLTDTFPYNYLKKYVYAEQDTHYDNLMIRWLGPNLGLPSLSATTEPNVMQGGGLSKYYSALSAIEHQFWEITYPHRILSTCQASWLGKMCFAMTDYTSWFRDFVEKRIDDTQAAKDELEEDYDHYPKPDEPLNEDLLTLMLLDMGVLYLDNGNRLGAQDGKPIIEPGPSSLVPAFRQLSQTMSQQVAPVHLLQPSSEHQAKQAKP